MDKTYLTDISAFALDEAKRLGADDAAAYVSSSSCDEVTAERGNFDMLRSYEKGMLDITVFLGGKSASATCGELSREAVSAAVREAYDAAQSADDTGASLYKILHRKEFIYGPEQGDIGQLSRAAKKFFFDLRADGFSPDITAGLCTDFSDNKKVFASLSGAYYFEQRNYYNMSLRLAARRGKLSTNSNTIKRSFYDLDQDFIEMPLVRQYLMSLPMQLDMKPVGAKFSGDVILAPQVVDLMLQYLPSYMSAKGGRFDSKIGDKCFASCVTLTSMPAGGVLPGGYSFTLEGREAFDTVLIRKGVFEATLPRRRKALRPFGASGTDEGFVMPGGDSPLEDMIKGIERGLYVGRLASSYPAGEGDISGIAKQSFLIEDGKITSAVVSSYIGGNICDMFQNAKGVSSEVINSGNAALPFMHCSDVVISG